jgi:hypothetical protein
MENAAGSESGYIVADPLNPDITYGGNYMGLLQRLDHRTGESRAINVWPIDNMGAGAKQRNIVFNGTILFSFHQTILKNYMQPVIIFSQQKMKEDMANDLT